MTEQDRLKWNAKYSEHIGDFQHSELLEKYISLAPKGKALDIACGNGRNSRYLAQ